ncbi:hypothetical protein D3C81_1201250 [compost metagenome]
MAGQPPDPPARPMQFAIGQPPHRAGIAGGIAQILPTRPMVSVRQAGQRFEPMTQGIALPGTGHLRKRRQLKRPQAQPGKLTGRAGLTQIHVRQFFEQSLRLTQMRRAAGHGRHRLRPALDQHGQDLMPKVIARVLPILVRGIFDPAQAMRTGISLQLSPRDIKHWPQQMPLAQRALTRHPGQSAHARSAQQAKQQGFRLIVAVLGSQQHFVGLNGFSEGVIPRIPSCTFKAGTRLHLHANHLQRHAQRSAHGTTMFRPRIGYGLKAVMHMDGVERRQGFGLGECCQKVQQDSGVEAAGEGDAPGRSIAPRGKIQQESGGQINIGPTHIHHLAQIKCGSGLAREGGSTFNAPVDCYTAFASKPAPTWALRVRLRDRSSSVDRSGA